MSLASLLHLHTRPSDALIFTLLAAPHLLYAHAWLFSKAWRSAFGSNAVRVLEVLAAAGKAGQFWAAAAFFVSRGGSVAAALAAASPARLLLATTAIALGQALNLAVYASIGGDGVYYGTRLGKRVPWVHGFPFALGGGGKPGKGLKVPHPQYLGSALTALGALGLLWHGAPAGSAAVVGYWAGLYAVTAVQEDLL